MYYKPKDGWAADFIPFYWDGAFRLFYLHDYRDVDNHGEGTPWRQISTKDFVHFTEHGQMLARGTKQEQDLYVFTGSVIETDHKFHIFYTGHNPHFRQQGKPEQAVMHAISDDLLHWEKQPSDTFFAPAQMGYEPNDWRDPFVFWDNETACWHMLLAARRTTGPQVRRGVTAHCISFDLRTWKTVEPLWEPQQYYTHECPDLFRMGEWYYLIYSEFTDRCLTRYVMSHSLQGPWIAPADDAFDTRAYYAAKSYSDGEKRYLFGWNPTKVNEQDNQPFMWGGNLVVHEIYQMQDGTLAVREPESIQKAWGQGHSPQLYAVTGDCTPKVHGITLTRDSGNATAAAQNRISSHCRISFDAFPMSTVKSFGIQLGYNEASDDSFALVFDMHLQQVSFMKMPNYPWSCIENRGLARVCPCDVHKAIHLDITVCDSAVVAYIDHKLAFSTRMYESKGSGFAFFVNDGSVCFDNIAYYEMNTSHVLY